MLVVGTALDAVVVLSRNIKTIGRRPDMNKDILLSVIGAGVVIACAKVISNVIGNMVAKDCYAAGYEAGYTDMCDESKGSLINSRNADETQEKEGYNHDEA